MKTTTKLIIEILRVVLIRIAVTVNKTPDSQSILFEFCNTQVVRPVIGLYQHGNGTVKIQSKFDSRSAESVFGESFLHCYIFFRESKT